MGRLNSKKELLIASALAIVIAASLGILSYSLLPSMPLPKTLQSALDVYTQKSGVGANASGGDFEPHDTAFIYAYLTQGDTIIRDVQVTFTLKNPENVEVSRTALTNETGIAMIDLPFLPPLLSPNSIIGTWQILASTSVENKTASDELSLQCLSQSAQIKVEARKKGLESTVFLPEDEASLNAQVTFKDMPIGGAQVIFEAKAPNDTLFFTQTLQTDNSGTAATSFNISGLDQNPLGTWRVSVQSQVYQQQVTDEKSFNCQVLPVVLDVYTQKGGYGPNEESRPFAPFEMVYVYAEIRDPVNKTIPYELIGFETRKSGNTLFYRVNSTNSSGIATSSFRMPHVGSLNETYEVYARAEINGTVIIDTITFKCEFLGMLDAYTSKGGNGLGQDGGSFLLNETLYLYAELRDAQNQTVPDRIVTFEVRSPNGNVFLTETAQTNSLGMVSLVLVIPADASYLGTWRVDVNAVYADAILFDEVTFTCQ